MASATFDRIFGALPARGDVWPALVNAALTLVLAFFAAQLFWVAVTPVGPIGRPVATTAAAAPIDFAALSRFDPFHRAPVAGAVGDIGSLGLTLFAVRAAGADGGGAIIQLPGRGQRSFSIGEMVAPGVALKAVGPDHVVLERDGATFQLSFPNAPASTLSAEAPAPASAGPPAPSGDATLRVASTIDPAALVSELALQARIENGEVTGYTLREGRAGPILRRLGLQPGDVLLEVNNRRLLDDERVAELQTELMSRPEAVIRYERSGEIKTTTVRVVQP